MNNIPNNYMSTRGVESNPWNLPQQEVEEWNERFMGSYQIQQFNIISDEDFEFVNDDDYDDDDDLTSRASSSMETEILMPDESVQQQEITSSTPSITSLNAVNSIQNKNVWILQPALNSVYNSMIPVPPCHFKKSTGDYQMNFVKDYDNALMTPMVENTCLVDSRDRCSLQTIQSNIFNMMIAMDKYTLRKPAERESLVSNYNYLAQLVTTMEAGLKAQREWNTVIQSLRHHSNHNSSMTTDLQSLDLSFMIKRTTQRCSEKTIDDQTPMTTLFDHYRKTSFPTNFLEENSHFSQEEEITAHRMHMMMTEIQEMINQINNNNTDFMEL